jgi:MFS family permease
MNPSAITQENGTPGGVNWLLAGLLAIFGFLGALDQNVIVTALPRMLGDTGVPIMQFTTGIAPAIQFDRASWLVTGYLLGYVAVLPLMGAVSDVYGRRQTLLAALVIFAVGSVLAAVAHTLPGLVLARTFQALGAGALLPVAVAAVADMTDRRQQGLVLGLVAGAAELGGVCGPLYGAFITQLSDLGWRLIFWLNVPIVAALIPLTLLLPAQQRNRPVDYAGGLTLGLALAALVAGASSSGIFATGAGGGTANRWLLLLTAGLLMVLWRLERRAASPLLPENVVLRPAFIAACAVNLLVGVGLGVTVVAVPLYATAVQDVGPVAGGLLLLRYLLMLVVGAVLGGWLRDRFGPRPVVVGGMALAAAGYWLMRAWMVSPPHIPSWPPPLLAGFGVGLVAAPVTTAALYVAERDRGGMIASLITAARVVGMMVGLSALTSWGSWRFQILSAGIHVPSGSLRDGFLGLQHALAAYGIALQDQGLIILRDLLAGASLCSVLALFPALLLTGSPKAIQQEQPAEASGHSRLESGGFLYDAPYH